MSSSGLKNFEYISITKHPFEEHGTSVTKTNVLKMKKGSFHSASQFDLWFLKKISKGARFFTVVHARTKCLNEAHTKFFQLLNYTFKWTSDFYWYEHVYIQKESGVSKHSWKKTMQLLWTVVTYLLKNVKQGIEHDIDSTYGDIRHS